MRERGLPTGTLQYVRRNEVNDQSVEISDDANRLLRAPLALRIAGGASLAWGAFLGLGMIAAILATQSMFGDVDTVDTLADWTATGGLVVVGRGLLRSRWWSGVAAWVRSLVLMVFGVYWAIWGNSDTGPGAPFPDPLTGAGLPWPVFVGSGLVIGAMLLPRCSRTWIREARRATTRPAERV